MLEPRYEPSLADSAQSPLSTRREGTPFIFIGERLWLDFVNTDDLRRGVRFDALRELVLKTTGLADVLREALEPLTPQLGAAFVFGSSARREDTASSDIDLFVMSDTLTFSDLFSALESARARLGRDVNPIVHSRSEIAVLRRKKNSFIERVIDQPKIWIYGDEDVFTAR